MWNEKMYKGEDKEDDILIWILVTWPYLNLSDLFFDKFLNGFLNWVLHKNREQDQYFTYSLGDLLLLA
jgi:hypothetical protein